MFSDECSILLCNLNSRLDKHYILSGSILSFWENLSPIYDRNMAKAKIVRCSGKNSSVVGFYIPSEKLALMTKILKRYESPNTFSHSEAEMTE